MEASAAWQQMDGERKAWMARLPESPDAVLVWVLAQDQATVLRLLTFLTASTVTGVYGEERECHSADALAKAVGLDMRKWWSATGPSYFNHVSKGRIVEVTRQTLGATAAQRYTALKKGAAASLAEQVLTDSGWLPDCLKSKAGPGADEELARADVSSTLANR